MAASLPVYKATAFSGLAPWIASASVKDQQRLWAGVALIIFTIVALLTITPFWPVWFWYHPAAMMVAYFIFMSNAVLIKKLGGKQATKMHGYLMAVATLCAAFGWYVIHSNKAAMGKKHITTWHGLIGLVVLLSTFAAALAGMLLLDPDFGMMAKSRLARLLHRYSGKGIITLAFFTSLLGWYTIKQQNILLVTLFTGPLALLILVLVK